MTEPRHIILNPETTATVLHDHKAVLEQDGNTVVVSAEQLMMVLLAMKNEDGPEIPRIALDEAG